MADEELKVPNADDGYQGDEPWQLREQVKKLGEANVRMRTDLVEVMRERDFLRSVVSRLADAVSGRQT